MPGAPSLTGRTILQVIPDLETGGAERTTLEVGAALVRAGARSLVASAGGGMVAQLEAEGSEHVTLPISAKSPLEMRRNRARLLTLIERENIALLHARSRAPAWPTLWAARAANRPFVTTYHGAYGGKTKLKRLYNSVMARGDVVIANSRFTEAAIREAFAGWKVLEGRRIVTIPRGADLTRFGEDAVTPARRAAMQARLGGEGALRLLLPGRLTEWKGQRTAIEAARLLQTDPRVPALRVVLAGSAQGRDGYEEALRAMIETHGLEDTVHLAGHVEDMPAAYLWSDVTLSCSTRPEAFGRVAVEAMASGRPVIATALGGSLETVAEGETGLLVPPGDPQALADAVVRLADRDRRAALGAAAARHARARFTTEAMTSATLSVYKDVLAGREVAR